MITSYDKKNNSLITKRPSLSTSTIYTLFLPGLGHVVYGQWKRGLVISIIFFSVAMAYFTLLVSSFMVGMTQIPGVDLPQAMIVPLEPNVDFTEGLKRLVLLKDISFWLTVIIYIVSIIDNSIRVLDEINIYDKLIGNKNK